MHPIGSNRHQAGGHAVQLWQYTVCPSCWNFRYLLASLWKYFSSSDPFLEAGCEAQAAIRSTPAASRTERKIRFLAMLFTLSRPAPDAR